MVGPVVRPNLQAGVADFLLVQTGFQGAELARQQAALDLLDKLEALLGFGKDGSGRGFERLLRRRSMRSGAAS
jgi:hypothetical protein